MGTRRVLARGEDHGRGGDASEADEVTDQVPLPVQEIRHRRPEQRRHDAHSRDASRVVVQLRHAVLVGGVALHVQGQQRVAAERLRLAGDDPEDDEAPPVPGREDLLQEAPRQGAAVVDLGHAGHGERPLGLGEVEGLGGVGGVREEQEAVERHGQRDDAVDDEQPAPPAQATQAVHALVDPCLDEATDACRRMTLVPWTYMGRPSRSDSQCAGEA